VRVAPELDGLEMLYTNDSAPDKLYSLKIVCWALREAAAEGDRSENAEYIYRKKQLREIDSRLRFLMKRLDVLIVVDEPPEDQSKVYFGAWVRLEDEDGAQQSYRIVGPDEFDLKAGAISVDSPMARALLKKMVEDEVCVKTPNGDKFYDVVEIAYEPFDDFCAG
jgi:transcription elongation factor GreB